MKKLLLISLIAMFCNIAFVQSQTSRVQKAVTNFETGVVYEQQLTTTTIQSTRDGIIEGSSREIGINWNFTDAAAIGSKIKVSAATGMTLNSWWLNDERVSLYEGTSAPNYEIPILTEWEYPIDMTEDGQWWVVGFDSTVQVYSTTSSAIVWEKIFDAGITGVKISPDGLRLYIVENNRGGQDKTYVSCYQVGNDDPDWETSFSGLATAFAASGDRSTLVFCQYSGVNKMWVIDAENGDVVFDAYYKNQQPPALSYDGKIILNGDYSGYAYLYEYDENLQSYYEKWNFKVGGGGTSAWVLGMGVSADGSTVAIGTLVFLSGGYDGEIYTFNSFSPEPLWVFENCGDEINAIDISDDGSIIAASGWGPIDHSKPDFFIFRKESNDPLFSINTAGSFNTLDLSADGTLCSASGKAVHAREFGSGGILYNVNSDPGGGSIFGNVEDQGAQNLSGVKITVDGLDNYFAYSDQEGSYEIKYVPEGTYAVTGSKVGYYPETAEDVPVVEGQAVEVGFIMESTGNPPFELSATQGAGEVVLLEWEHPSASNTDGFNIYRKTIAEALFPEEPIASIGNDLLEFEDADVKPLTHYYYAVTAILEADVESPYSNTAEGWMASGFVINNISVYYGSTPTIDGEMSAGEWDDAFEMDASDFLGTYDNMPNPVGSVMMYYKVNQDMTELYVACINLNDTVLEDHDEVALYVDDNNDKSYPETGDDSEGNYWAVYYASGNLLRYRPIYNTGSVGTAIELENPQVEVSDATGHIVYEFMIPMGEEFDYQINPNEDNESGMFSFTLDDPSNFDGYWPCQNQQIFLPDGYGSMTFGAEDEVPPPPEDVYISWEGSYSTDLIIELSWTQPEINDFELFRVYCSEQGGGFTLLSETIGRQIFIVYPPEAGYLEYYITTVDKSGQESEPSEIVLYDIIPGINEMPVLTSVELYPNPVRDVAIIKFDVEASANYDITLVDLNGRKVLDILSGNLKAGEYVIPINGNNVNGAVLKNGIYLVKITGQMGTITKKLILGR